LIPGLKSCKVVVGKIIDQLRDPIGVVKLTTCDASEHMIGHTLVTGKKDGPPVVECHPLFDLHYHSFGQQEMITLSA
jgi:hypothetical protein